LKRSNRCSWHEDWDVGSEWKRWRAKEAVVVWLATAVSLYAWAPACQLPARAEKRPVPRQPAVVSGVLGGLASDIRKCRAPAGRRVQSRTRKTLRAPREMRVAPFQLRLTVRYSL